MTTQVCPNCGEEYVVGPDSDPFTMIFVSFHAQDQDDIALSVCKDCGEELTAGVIEVAADV